MSWFRLASPRILLGPALVATVIVMAVADGASAADWGVSGFFSQRLEAENGGDSSLGSTTSVGVVATLRDAVTTITLAPGVTGALSTSDDLDLTTIRPRFNSSFLRRGKRLTLTAAASFVPELISSNGSLPDVLGDGFTPVDPGDPGDPGDPTNDDGQDALDRTNSNGVQLNTRVNAGARWALSPISSVSANGFVRLRRYSNASEDFVPTDTYGVSLGYSRSLSDITSVSLTSAYERFSDDGDTQRTSDTLRLSTGLSTALSPTLRFSGNVGGTLVQSRADDPTGDDTSLNFTGGARLNWTKADWSFSAGVSQAIRQNTDGTLENRTSGTLGAGYRINEVSSISLSGSVGADTPVFTTGGSGGDTTTLSVGAAYTRSLTDSWSLNLGYRLRLELENNSLDNSEDTSTVFLQISRRFSVLP